VSQQPISVSVLKSFKTPPAFTVAVLLAMMQLVIVRLSLSKLLIPPP